MTTKNEPVITFEAYTDEDFDYVIDSHRRIFSKCENRFNLAWLSQLNGTTTKFAGSLASDLFLFGFEGAATLPQTLSKMFRNRYLLSLDLTLSTQHRVDVSVF